MSTTKTRARLVPARVPGIAARAVAAALSTGALASGERQPVPVAAKASAIAAVPAVAVVPSVAPGPVAAPAAPATDLLETTLERLSAKAPELERDVLRLALAARQRATAGGLARKAELLTVIDYSLPSTTKRLWVFDVERGEVLFHELVAHGKNTGDNFARRFSNSDGSLQTSLGLFRTVGTYVGGNGYSLKLDGLEPGLCSASRWRLRPGPAVRPTQSRARSRRCLCRRSAS